MKILVIGGTRFFGIHMVTELIKQGHNVTIATRGNAFNPFGDSVSQIILERTNAESIREALKDMYFDVVIDKIAYCSNDIKYVLDAVKCDKYIHMSSTAVYAPKHLNTKEKDFDYLNKKLVWCSRSDFPYAETKRQAECALWQAYPYTNAIAVRYPFVIGKDDYTKRLLFYVEHIIQNKPMYIDNLNSQMSYIHSDEAGAFMAFLINQSFTGPINGASSGTISLKEILEYVKSKTGKGAILSSYGDPAPYNGEVEYSINTDKAHSLGFEFTNLKAWIFDLIDYYIELVISSL